MTVQFGECAARCHPKSSQLRQLSAQLASAPAPKPAASSAAVTTDRCSGGASGARAILLERSITGRLRTRYRKEK